jgi:hypothetical protein
MALLNIGLAFAHPQTLHEHHEFIRDDDGADPAVLSWEKRMAKKYYDKVRPRRLSNEFSLSLSLSLRRAFSLSLFLFLSLPLYLSLSLSL